MKNKALFEKTVGILVDAYRNDTLDYTDPCGCAVGNLCAAANGYRVLAAKHKPFVWVDKHGQLVGSKWPSVFIIGRWRNPDNKEGLKEIEPTGYTASELIRVERAFRDGWLDSKGKHGDPQLTGLLAVYDVLCEIHEVEKEEAAEGREVFV